MKNKSRIVFILSLVFAVNAFAPNAMAFNEEELSLQRMQDRLNTMEKSMSTMQQELYRSSGKSKSKHPISEEPIGAGDERDRAMNGKIEELEHNITSLAAKLDKIIADIDFRIAALEKKVAAAPVAEAVKPPVVAATPAAPTAPVDTDAKADEDVVDGIDAGKQAEAASALITAHAVPSVPTAAAKPPVAAAPVPAPAAAKPAASPAKIAYDKAYEFIKLSKYDDAEKAFKDFIANNKGSDLMGNAYFWLGESYYSRQNYQSSAVNFLKGYQDFPKGNKAADSLFKLGLSLKGMKKDKEACATYSKTKKEYPTADKALLAKVDAERKELKCK